MGCFRGSQGLSRRSQGRFWPSQGLSGVPGDLLGFSGEPLESLEVSGLLRSISEDLRGVPGSLRDVLGLSGISRGLKEFQGLRNVSGGLRT